MSDIKDFQENEAENIYFKIKKKDEYSFFKYMFFIEYHLEQRTPIPLRVFKKFMSYFAPKDEAKENFYNGEAKEISKEVIQYFKKDEKYYFIEQETEIEDDDIPTDEAGVDAIKKTSIITVSFEEMINETVSKVFRYRMGRRINKKECINICYDVLNKYKTEKLDNKIKHDLSSNNNYKLRVIAGYITHKCGISVTKAKPLTKAKIFQGTRNAFPKQNAENKI